MELFELNLIHYLPKQLVQFDFSFGDKDYPFPQIMLNSFRALITSL